MRRDKRKKGKSLPAHGRPQAVKSTQRRHNMAPRFVSYEKEANAEGFSLARETEDGSTAFERIAVLREDRLGNAVAQRDRVERCVLREAA